MSDFDLDNNDAAIIAKGTTDEIRLVMTGNMDDEMGEARVFIAACAMRYYIDPDFADNMRLWLIAKMDAQKAGLEPKEEEDRRVEAVGMFSMNFRSN